EEFRLGLALLGMDHREFGELLEVAPERVEQWAEGSERVPKHAQLVLGSLLDTQKRELSLAVEGWAECLPPFLLADDGDREFIVHAHEPVFIGELLEDDDLAGAAAEASYRLGFGYSLTNLVWFSPAPDDKSLALLMEAAADFLDAMEEKSV
ncbi:MAG: hypothetical protein SNJ82_13550, partial [Gemmataceae bacterium]